MPGKLYDGRAVTEAKNGVKNNCKAYCEGMAYRAGDTALNRPRTDVSKWHQAGSEAERAWLAGWDVADNAAGGNIAVDVIGPCGGMPAVPL